MSSDDRRANARRRAWGRGPAVLRFEPLEGRQLLSIADPVAQIASAAGADTSKPSTSTTSTTTTPTADELAALAAQSGTAVVTTSTPTTTSTSSTSTYDSSNLVASAFDTYHNLDWGDPFHAVGTVRNLGSSPTRVAYNVSVYASTTPTLGSSAVLVGKVTIPAGIAGGAKTDFDAVLTAPPVPLATLGSSTSYYLVPKLAPESGTTKPTATAGSPLNSVVTVTPKVPPNLVGAGISVSPGSIAWGGVLNVTASVKNDSQGVAPPTNARIVLTPVGKTPGGGSDYQIGQVPIPSRRSPAICAARSRNPSSENLTMPMHGQPAAAHPLMDLGHAQRHRPRFAAVQPYHSRLETGEVGEIADDTAPERSEHHAAFGETARRHSEPLLEDPPATAGDIEPAVQRHLIVMDPVVELRRAVVEGVVVLLVLADQVREVHSRTIRREGLSHHSHAIDVHLVSSPPRRPT